MFCRLDSYVSPSGRTFCVTTDTFYIEIRLEDDGAVKDVKVAHPAKSFLVMISWVSFDVLLHVMFCFSKIKPVLTERANLIPREK